jgi:hypothetical protein
MFHSGAVLGFTYKTCDCRFIVTELFAKHFEGDSTVAWMNGFVDGRRPAFADLTLQRVPGYL